MKNILLILLLFFLSVFLSSCLNKDENNVIIKDTNKIGSKKINNELGNSKKINDELQKITNEEFKPLLLELENMDISMLSGINCSGFFYLPEAEKRFKNQLDIQKEYIKKCKEIKNNKK